MYDSFEQFIEHLKSLSSTEEILYTVYQYFKNYVSYNYDDIQLVKYFNGTGGLDLIDTYSMNHPVSEESKQEMIRMLDESFQRLEGRGLTENNKKVLFENYGKTVHYNERPTEKVFSFGKERIIEHPAMDVVNRRLGMIINDMGNGEHQLATYRYPATYYDNGMLKSSVCDRYASWMKEICDILGIHCLIVHGKGTTGHAWNAIYIPEKECWVNFDMTMVKFYQDGWLKDHEPYIEDDWVLSSTDEMMRMQPTRKVESVNTSDGLETIDSIEDYKKLLERLTPGVGVRLG